MCKLIIIFEKKCLFFFFFSSFSIFLTQHCLACIISRLVIASLCDIVGLLRLPRTFCSDLMIFPFFLSFFFFPSFFIFIFFFSFHFKRRSSPPARQQIMHNKPDENQPMQHYQRLCKTLPHDLLTMTSTQTRQTYSLIIQRQLCITTPAAYPSVRVGPKARHMSIPLQIARPPTQLHPLLIGHRHPRN